MSVFLAILYYDYILVAPTEVDRFWKTFRPSGVSILYLLNRIISLFGHIPVIVLYFGSFSDEVSQHFRTIKKVF